MSTTMNHYTAPPSVYLNIGTMKEKEEFLKELLPDFLHVVEPWKSGLLDQMVADGLLTDTDRDSLSGKHVQTDRDLRRKVWFLLTRLSVSEVKTKVFPKLYQSFPHIIPKRFLAYKGEEPAVTFIDDAQGKECLRHEIMRNFRPNTVIDKMYQYDFLNLDKYRSYSMGGCSAEQLWPMLFSLCETPSPGIFHMMKDLMETHRTPVPPDLASLLARRIPCTCSQGTALLLSTPSTCSRWNQMVGWVKSSPFGLDPRSSGSSRSSKISSVFTINSGHKPFEPVVNSGTPQVQSSAAAAVPLRDVCNMNSGMGRAGGEVNALSGFAGNESPHVSVTGRRPNPSAKTLARRVHPTSGDMDTTVWFPTASAQIVGSTGIHIEDGLNLVDDAFHVQDSPSYPPRPETGVFVWVFSEVRKFLKRNCLIIILFMAIALSINVTMSGFHIFQFGESNEHILDTVKRALTHQSEQLKNFTSVLQVVVNQTKNAQAKDNISKT